MHAEITSAPAPGQQYQAPVPLTLPSGALFVVVVVGGKTFTDGHYLLGKKEFLLLPFLARITRPGSDTEGLSLD